jgi:hypothetical protein
VGSDDSVTLGVDDGAEAVVFMPVEFGKMPLGEVVELKLVPLATVLVSLVTDGVKDGETSMAAAAVGVA